MATLKDVLNAKLPDEEKRIQQQEQGPKVGDYSLLQEAPRALGRGVANLVGGLADYLDMNSQVSGLHGVASSPNVEVSKEQLNAPGVLNDIGNYAAQKQQDWRKTTTTGKGLGDLMNGDASYITSGEIFGDTLESAPTMLPGVAIGALGGPEAAPLAIALATGGTQAATEAGNTYRDLRKKGYDQERAKDAAMGDFYTKAALYTMGDVATAGAVRAGGSKTLGNLLGANKDKATALIKRAEEFATKHPKLDKYGRPLASWAGGVASEMNETATETKLGDVWEKYAQTGELNAGDILQAFNPAYQTEESRKGAIQTIGPAGILVGGGMAVNRKRNGNTTTNTETNTEEQATTPLDIPESAEERATLTADLQAQNAQSEQRIQELDQEIPKGVGLDEMTPEQIDMFGERQELLEQVAENKARLAAMGVEQESTPAGNSEQTGPRTVEQINSEISDIEARQRNASGSELQNLAKQRQALIAERDVVERDNTIQAADLQTLQKEDKALNAEYNKVENQINSAQNNIANLDPQQKDHKKKLSKAQKKLKELWVKQEKIKEQRDKIAERMAAIEEANKPKPADNAQPQQQAAQQPLVNEQEQLRQQNQNAQDYYEQQGQQARDEEWYAMEQARAEANGQTPSQNQPVTNEADRLLAENQSVQDNLNTANAQIEYDENIPAKQRLQAIRQQRDEVIGPKSNAIESQRQAQEARSQAAEQAVLGNRFRPEPLSDEQRARDAEWYAAENARNNPGARIGEGNRSDVDAAMETSDRLVAENESVNNSRPVNRQGQQAKPFSTLTEQDRVQHPSRSIGEGKRNQERRSQSAQDAVTGNRLPEVQERIDRIELPQGVTVRGKYNADTGEIELKFNKSQGRAVGKILNDAGYHYDFKKHIWTGKANETTADVAKRLTGETVVDPQQQTRDAQWREMEERRRVEKQEAAERKARENGQRSLNESQDVADESMKLQAENAQVESGLNRNNKGRGQEGAPVKEQIKARHQSREVNAAQAEQAKRSSDNADVVVNSRTNTLLNANDLKATDKLVAENEVENNNVKREAAPKKKQNVSKSKEKVAEKKENVARETPQDNLQDKKKRLEKERSEILAEQRKLAEKAKTATGEELEKIRAERKELNKKFEQAGDEYKDVLKSIEEAKQNGKNQQTRNKNERTKPEKNQNSKTETESKNGKPQEDLDAGEAGVMRRYKTVQGYWNNHHKEKWSTLTKEQQAKAKAQFDAAQAESKASLTNEATTDRGVEKVINEAKKAFVGCKFERDGNALMVTLPNGKRFFINVKRKIVLSENQESGARAAHNLNGDMKAEGNWTKLAGDDVVGFMELATNGREGTAYHEALHAAMDLVLTDNERKALLDHFEKVAKRKSIDVEEAIADGYKEWVLARQKGKGAPFGRLFQKMKDFVDKMGKVLMGDKDFKEAVNEIATEVNEEVAKFKSRDIFAQIENGEVWKRGGNLIDADGETKHLVTNPDVNEKTKAYVVDITDFARAVLSDKKEIADAMQKAMKEREFKLGDSGAIVVLPENSNKDKEHYVRSKSDEQAGDSTRLKAVTAIENLLNNAVYIDKHDDHAHFTQRKYIEAYVPVRDGKEVYAMRITLRDAANTGTYKITKTELYNIEKKKPIPKNEVIKGGNGEYVTVGSMLKGVKDTFATPDVNNNNEPKPQGKNYLKNGKAVYDADAQNVLNQREAAAKAKAAAEEKARIAAEEKAKAEAAAKKEAKANKFNRGQEFYNARARAKGGKNTKHSAVRNDTAEGRAAQKVHRNTSKLPSRDRLHEMFNTFYENWLDKLDPLNRLQKRIENAAGQTLEFSKNVYKNARLARSNAASRSKMLVMGMKGATSKQVIKAINDTMKNVKLKYDVTLNDVLNVVDSNKMDKLYPSYLDKGAFENWQHALSTYLVARRQMEIQMVEPEYHGPMSAKDALAVVKNAPAEFKEAAKLYSQYNDNLLTILEDAGLISAAQHKALSDAGKNYAPMMRDFTDKNGNDTLDQLFTAVGGKGIGDVKAGLKELTKWGSEQAVFDPLQTTVMNTYAVLNRAERNKVGQIFADLAAIDPGDFIQEVGRGKKAKQKPDKSIFVVMQNGEKVAYKIAPEFYKSVVSINEDGGEFLAKYARGMAQALRTGATISPDFMLANVFRDTFHASVASEHGFKPIWDTIRGAYKLKTDAAFASEFEAAGIPMTGLIGANRRNAVDTLNRMAGNDKWKTLNPYKLGKAVWDTVFNALEDLGELAESGTRAGEYLLAKEKGKSMSEAAFAAKEITVDFSRSGKYGQKANQVIPFFNAVLQGGDRLARLYADPQTRTRAIMNTVKYIVLPSVALWACNHDKEWYKDLPEDVKNGNWCFKMGDTIIRLPKPQEAGVLFGSSIERMLDYAAEKDAKLTGDFAKYVLTDIVAPGFIPTVLGPYLEWRTGISLWTYKPVVGQRYQRLTPEKQYNVHTTEVAKFVGGVTGTSPMKIDNAIRGLWGGAGSFVAGSMDTFFNMYYGKEYERPAKDIADMPGVRRFTYQDGRRTQSTNDFFELYDRAVKYHNSYNKGKSDPVYTALVNTNKKLSEINKEIEGIYTSKTISPEDKKARIKEKEKLYSNYARKAVAVYKDKVK